MNLITRISFRLLVFAISALGCVVIWRSSYPLPLGMATLVAYIGQYVGAIVKAWTSNLHSKLLKAYWSATPAEVLCLSPN